MAKRLCWAAITAALFTGPSTVHGFNNLASLGGAERVASLTRSRDRACGPLNQRQTAVSFQLRSTKDEIDPYLSPELDTDAVTKYIIAAATEMSLFAGTFKLLDTALSTVDVQLPFPAIAAVFYASSLKSRVFNPLNNQRPDRAKAVEGEGSNGFRDRVMP